ncbi:hypothetical protein WSS_A15234 [Rhodococcus opacus M213]|uniref:Uncharacterized protein n=1 Tax=Rhodococcus opacus M213 TaxID=1129896 RepID=K8XUK3_RHOOP|nr:hypothetical protein WSS_A15234 [Rhodococcus opacus M213]
MHHCSELCEVIDGELDRVQARYEDHAEKSVIPESLTTEAWTLLVLAADAVSAYRQAQANVRAVAPPRNP